MRKINMSKHSRLDNVLSMAAVICLMCHHCWMTSCSKAPWVARAVCSYHCVDLKSSNLMELHWSHVDGPILSVFRLRRSEKSLSIGSWPQHLRLWVALPNPAAFPTLSKTNSSLGSFMVQRQGKKQRTSRRREFLKERSEWKIMCPC